MLDKKVTHLKVGEKIQRTPSYYERYLKKLCGNDYKNNLRPGKREEVKNFLRGAKTALVTGMPEEVACFRAEVMNIILRNNMSCVRTNDSQLVTLNFNEIANLPESTIENFMELMEPDFLWLDICTTRNKFIAFQILLIITSRSERGKRTILYSPSRDSKDWLENYSTQSFVDYLVTLQKNGQTYKAIEGYK